MHSMAIKINVSQKDQETINSTLEKAGYPHQRRKFHCTFGFIEKMIPEDESASFGQKMTHLLQEYIDSHSLSYEVEKIEHLFGHVIVFSPTVKSLVSLKEINLWLLGKVKEVSENRWELDQKTMPQNYIPHMALWRSRHPDARFKKLEEFAETHPLYHLTQAAYVIF